MRHRNNRKAQKHYEIDSQSSSSDGSPRKRRKMHQQNDYMCIRFQPSKNEKAQDKKNVTEKMRTPWANKGTISIKDSLLRLHNQIIDFYNYIKPSEKEHQARLSAFTDIKKTILKLFPEAQVAVFGSFATQLYLPDGDIDIVVLTNYKYEVSNVYSKINRALEADSLKYTQLQYIRKSKVPLIKFIYNNEQSAQFQFDISVDKPDGLYQVQYVQKMNKSYPEFKYLVFVLKCFLKIRGLAETYTGGIGSFLLFCMILVYLQDMHHQKRYYTLGEHVLKFMRFYGETDWSRKVIDIQQGGVLPRRAFDNNSTFSFISPQDSTHDIGKAAFKIREVFNVFKNRERYMIGKNFQSGSSILKELVNPREECFKYFKEKSKIF